MCAFGSGTFETEFLTSLVWISCTNNAIHKENWSSMEDFFTWRVQLEA
jgi:hypothetical protein